MPRDLAQQLAASLMPEARAGGQGMPAEIEITRVFSAKETLFKALYPQVRAIKEFSAARAIWNGDALSLALTEPWAEALPEGSFSRSSKGWRRVSSSRFCRALRRMPLRHSGAGPGTLL
ncbi:hypothetical protein QWZ10_02545 [Paracoccus cavernae]|uniref:Enterobactin synthase component D n=1 Tax=Paracoccus cavernae TaxID=1571207 RepID=A0ABT8D2I3_9RHOB|nr:hypothetical protein [Paracoccus cavernae]